MQLSSTALSFPTCFFPKSNPARLLKWDFSSDCALSLAVYDPTIASSIQLLSLGSKTLSHNISVKLIIDNHGDTLKVLHACYNESLVIHSPWWMIVNWMHLSYQTLNRLWAMYYMQFNTAWRVHISHQFEDKHGGNETALKWNSAEDGQGREKQ